MRQLLLGVVLVAAVLLAIPSLRDHPDMNVSVENVEPHRSGHPADSAPPTDSTETVRSRQWAAAGRFDSYLASMVSESNLGITRWPERVDDPLLIYLPASELPGYTPEHRRAVLAAFSRWSRVGPTALPVAFSFVRDSARADVKVVWVSSLADGKAGEATITRDGGGWIFRGRLALALGTENGGVYGSEATYTIALHEIGHLLGLGHSDDPDDVMYPSTSLQDLSARDRTTARLLYQLLPGAVPLP